MRILIALLIFGFLIFFHELGHYIFARINRVTVVEFSLGMGPRLISICRGGTRYSLKILPFGGSCMMLGEDEADMSEGTLGSKSVWARISVVAAGPVFNFLLAYILSVLMIGNIGYDIPVVLKVSDGLPAMEAGIKAGDIITGMNGKAIHFYRQIPDYASFHEGEPVLFEYERDGEKYEAYVEPVLTENGYKYGISGSFNYRQALDIPGVLKYSFFEVGYWIDVTINSLKMIGKGKVTLDDMSGPVGVVNVIGETYEESREDGFLYVWLNLINIATLLSANLGVMNLLPIPALDGGRLLFLILEAIRRKKVDPETEARIHVAGLLLLLLLMVVVMFNDIRKIFL